MKPKPKSKNQPVPELFTVDPLQLWQIPEVIDLVKAIRFLFNNGSKNNSGVMIDVATGKMTSVIENALTVIRHVGFHATRCTAITSRNNEVICIEIGFPNAYGKEIVDKVEERFIAVSDAYEKSDADEVADQKDWDEYQERERQRKEVAKTTKGKKKKKP